ncbi:5-formyltetrahydrofolate cyclo-ligase [Wenzhouxiangella sp. EGI_FJ10409]|uniref:5-formyltetrahydrofolate cyclo-ligase n=1 Tax=Wenzhouxiangella sp. EGI_FJ10409 TaxID=3243767 RepID=UPI0035D7AF9E
MDSQHGQPETKAELRRRLVARRKALPALARESADAAIGRNIERLCRQTRSQRIAAFVAHGGEADLMPVADWLHRSGHQVFLPVVRGRQMHFRRWRPDGEMAPNRYGIPEPVDGEDLAAAALELVLVPLVGFAPNGARLGMGAGFYDRAFAFQSERIGRLPRLVGVAYAVQEVEVLPVDEWDVPLDGIVTEDGLRWF